jgi:Leucine-rich repeat (LRR) protein
MTTKFTHVLSALALSLFVSDAADAQVNVQDSLALVDLYNSTGGPNWNSNNNWLTAAPVKTWSGIYSVNSDNRVTYIDLRRNNLSGSIPSSFGDLNKLEILFMEENDLSGNIPAGIGNMVNLVYLRLANNRLSGNIPASLGNLVKLTSLELNNNQLTGNIPSSLGNLVNLQGFSLSNNQLSGSIPSSFGNFKGLYGLSLDHNKLTGNIPPELGNVGFIGYLDLSYNQLTGSIPATIGDISIEYLLLNNNQLSGNIPSLKKLGINRDLVINLSYNQLSGNIPASLADNGRFLFNYFLDLSHNELSGRIPKDFGGIGYGFTYLDLSNNQLTGSIPPSLGNLNQLRTLYLDSNQLAGSLPPELGQPYFLEEINLMNNKLKGDIPSSFGDLYNLQYLLLSHNKLSGNIPSTFSKLINLIRLNVGDNILSGVVPAFLGTSPGLKRVNLRHNHYTFDGLEKLIENNTLDTLKYERQRKLYVHQNNKTLSVYAGGTLNKNTYRWFKDGIEIATVKGDSTYAPVTTGNYSVQIANDIATELTLYSDTVRFNALNEFQQNNVAAFKASSKTDFLIYPNPAKTTATIAFRETGSCIIKLADVSGKVLQMKTIDAVKESNILQLDISRYVKGVYFITIVNRKNETKTLLLNKQ